MIRITETDPNKTYPYVTRSGRIVEMTPAQAEEYRNRDMTAEYEKLVSHIADRCRAMTTGAESGKDTMRWNPAKELLYDLVHGTLPPEMKNGKRRTKYASMDLTTFQYETLDYVSLTMIYECIVRRTFICM